MKSQKLLVFVSALLVMAFVLSACGGAANTAVPGSGGETGTGAQTGEETPTGNTSGETGQAGEKPYAGTTLRFVASNHPWTDAITPLLPDFEAQTGIKVNLEAYGEDQLTQKLTTEFTAGSSDIDVFMQRPLQEARLFVQNGWYVDLYKYVNDPELAGDWNFDDFMKGAVSTEIVNDVLTGIPVVTESEILYYRKDLLDAAGIEVPETLEELEAAAAKLNDPNNNVYGFVARGQRSPAVTQFSSFLYSMGGDWMTEEGQATLNTPEAVAAFELYGKLLREYGPPGVLNMSWPQAVAVFAQGQAALYTDSSAIFNNVLDPTKSTVSDKTGVAAFPAGPAGANMYNVTPWALSIPATAPNADAAWEFIKWATSTEVTLKTQGDAMVPSARNSVWADPAGTAKFPADWVAAVQASSDGRGYDRPRVVQVGAARDIIGSVITTAIEGGDVAATAETANGEFQALIDQEVK